MTSQLTRPRSTHRVTVADIIETFAEHPLPLRVCAYDGSATGDPDAPIEIRLTSPKALSHMLTAPGDLGMARAYLTDELQVSGSHPGDPYELFRLLKRHVSWRRPTLAQTADLLRGLDLAALRPPPPPDIESLPRWRRALEGLREPSGRRAAAIGHHYDVSNAFYEKVLGPSMAYTCAVFADPGEPLEDAQERKHALVAGKLALREGMTLLDVGCGWGGMVRHAARRGVKALGVTLSRRQAEWGQRAVEEEGLAHLAEVRHLDYRDAPRQQFDAISSIGLTEHIGVSRYRSYFGELFDRLRPGGRLLNHCITRGYAGDRPRPQAFTDRYVFPDGELAAPARVMRAIHQAGFEVQHGENLRMSYAHTLARWCRNLVDNWDFCVGEVGLPTAKVWGLYMAGSRAQFEANALQLHQFLATKPGADGAPGYPLRPDWDPRA